MGPMPSDLLILKVEGNTYIKNSNYLAAIARYDEALKRARSEADAVVLLLNRCHARLQAHYYDAALADAIAVIDMSLNKTPEKALFRAARASYGLQRWQESLDYLRQLAAAYPDNRDAHKDIARCKCRLREQAGDYDFKSMLDEVVAKAPSPDMDRANFFGPVEVRDCAIRSHGRGLFTTRTVKPGELLLCEKAFATVFADPYDPTKLAEPKKEEYPDDENMTVALSMMERLTKKTLAKLHRNPSLQAGYAELYPGPDHVDEMDEETGLPFVDEPFVEFRFMYNNFGFPIITHDYHWDVFHHPNRVPDDLVGSRGIWLRASFINHSCYPMVRRSFLGDMMIFRSQQYIPADTELKFGYISALEEVEDRQSKLKKYGFDCDCQICKAEMGSSAQMRARRKEICAEIYTIFNKGDVHKLQTYTDLLDTLDDTYTNPPRIEYHRAMITPLTNLITGCLTSELPFHVIELVYRLLKALGFEIQVTETSFRILQWGFIIDELVIALVELCDAYKVVDARLVEDAERAAKVCYLIMCGEDISWEGAYGKGGKRERELGKTEVEGLEKGAPGVDVAK